MYNITMKTMVATETSTECTCRSCGCAARIAHGLKPFCRVSSADCVTKRDEEVFQSYEAAAAACLPGQKIVSARPTDGNLGGDYGFMLVWVRKAVSK